MNLLLYRHKRHQILLRISKAVRSNDVGSLDNQLNQLFGLMGEDHLVKEVLARHNRTFNDLRLIISTLETHGGKHIIHGHYLPVSSITFPKHLDAVLKYWNGKAFEVESMNTYHSNLYLAYHMKSNFSQ